MNCPWHPNKRVVSSCKDCGTGFCIECVRETDQTTLCPDCYRRKLNEIAREFTEPEEETRVPGAAPVSSLPGEGSEKPPSPGKAAEPSRPPQPAPFDDDTVGTVAAPREKKRAAGRRGRDKQVKAPAAPPEPPSEDFLSRGPDDDFSQIASGTRRLGKRPRHDGAAAPQPAGAAQEPPTQEPAAVHAVEDIPAVPPAGGSVEAQSPREVPRAKDAPSEDRLLQDVMSTLLSTDAGAVPQPAVADRGPEAPAQPEPPAAVHTAPPARAAREERSAARREKRAERALAAREKPPKERDAERWSFLAQPRSSEYTLIAGSWWRAALFIALMLLAGAVLWAVPNAYLVPKDQEYGIHAVLVGLILGLAFWWKAGKKHSTKLAVQAALTTFFALFIGEFLHWFLIVTKYSAFRTIFFDLISFRFLWENGAEIMKNVIDAMFPMAFIWLLLLPALTAFIVGFGMPPIPEIFFQVWHALRGQVPEEKEASHGLEG
ncbi:MAG: hypothetical protein AB1384_06965 [Actinomycetota bacterium]